MMRVVWNFVTVSILFGLVLSTTTGLAETAAATTTCEKEDDLDFENCKLEHLPIEELKAICERIGLNVEQHIFGATENDDDEHSHQDYVMAAEECLEVEDQMLQLLEEDPEVLSQLEQTMLEEDPALLAEVIAEVLSQSPDLLIDLEQELMTEEPELYADIQKELEEGQTFADRPDILADLVTLLLAQDPDMLQKLDEDLSSALYYGDTEHQQQTMSDEL